MLQRLGPRQRPLLGHVSHQKHRQALLLGRAHEEVPHLAHLRHAPRDGIQFGEVEGLDGIHDEEARLDLIHRLDGGAQVGLAEQEKIMVVHAETFGAHFDLGGRFLAADIQHLAAGGEGLGRLEHEGGFSHPRFAAQKDEAPRHDASAEDSVQSRRSRRQARHLLRFDIGQGGHARQRSLCGGFLFLFFELLDEGLPGPAFGTPPQPPQTLESARLADEL